MTSIATSNQSPRPTSGGVHNGGSIAWIPSHELDPRQWAIAGRRLGVVGRCIQWLLGDWIAYGNSRFGERYSRASQITGYDPQTLMNMVYVASRFQLSRRREDLSWSHHETLAALDEKEQDSWLDQAATHRWSVADLRMMLRTSRREAAIEAEEDDANVRAASPDPGLPDAGPDDRQMSGRGRSMGSDPDAGERAERALAATVLKCPRCGEDISLRKATVEHLRLSNL